MSSLSTEAAKCVKMPKERLQSGEARVEADFKELEASLGSRFSNPELLVCALTHRSLAHQLAQADPSKQAAPGKHAERLIHLGGKRAAEGREADVRRNRLQVRPEMELA